MGIHDLDRGSPCRLEAYIERKDTMSKTNDTAKTTTNTDVHDLEAKAAERKRALNAAFEAAYKAGLEAACSANQAIKRGEKAGKKRAIEILGEAELAEKLAEETRYVLAFEPGSLIA